MIRRMTVRLADARVPPFECGGGCCAPVVPDLAVDVWLNTALGVCCVKCHPECEGLAAGRHREQPAVRMKGRPSEFGKQAAVVA